MPAEATPTIFDATQANFEAEVLNASFDQPVLVDFWATWCEPCKTLGPLLEKVVADFHGAVKLAKVAWMPAKLRPTPSPKLWLRQEERRAATTIS